MAKGGAIAINIITTFDAGDIQKAQKELARLEASIAKPGDGLKAMGEKFQSAGKKISDVGMGITKSIGAVSAAFIAFGVSSIKAAADAEAQQNRLRQILLTTGAASEKQVEALNKQAKALEQVGVVSADNITVLQSQLATFDLQASTIQRLTPAILDYVTAEKGATASAEEFKSMTNGLAQALQGNFASLTKTGFVLDETTKNLIKNGTEAERSAALVQVLNSTYKGFNETLAGTTEGRLQVLRNRFDDVRERIGAGLLPVMESLLNLIDTKLIPFVEKLVTKFESLTDGQKKLTVAVVLFGAALGPILIGIGSVVTAIGTLQVAMAKLATQATVTRIAIKRLFIVLTLIAGAFLIAEKGADNLKEKIPALEKPIGMIETSLANFGKITSMLFLRIQYYIVAAGKELYNFLHFGLADTSRFDNKLKEIAQKWKNLNSEVEFDHWKRNNKEQWDSLVRQEQAMANRFKAATKSAGGGGGDGGAADAAAEAAKRRAEKLKEQAKLLKEINKEFQKFAVAAAAPEDTIESLMARANENLLKFQTTAADTTLKTDRLIARLQNLGQSLMDDLGAALDMAQKKLQEAQAAYDQFAQTVSNSIRGILNFGTAFETAQSRTQAAIDALNDKIDAQKDKLEQAQQTLKDYADTVSKAVSGTLNFGKAFETAQEKGTSFLDELKAQVSNAQTFAIQIKELVARGLSQEALEQVIGAGDAGSAIAKELLSGGAEAIKQANDLVLALQKSADETGLAAANKFYSAGVKSAQQILDGLTKEIAKSTSFMDALNEQAKKATEFAEKVKKLIAMGLSEEALKEVLAAGVESGTLIADSIIDGGQTVVSQINRLVASVQEVADSTGKQAADQFYKTGVDLAKAMVEGIINEINAAAAAIAAAIAAAAGARNIPGVTPPGGTPGKPGRPGGGPPGYDIMGNASQIGIPLAQLQSELAAQVENNKRMAARLAAGGLGANAVAALKDKLAVGRMLADELRTDIGSFPVSQSSSNAQVNYNLTVNAGLGTNGQDVGREIVEEILRFQRRSGEYLVEAV